MSDLQPALSERTPTHVCFDCGALGYAGGYHDHGNGNAGETIALKDLPAAIRALQEFETRAYEAEVERDEVARILALEAMEIVNGADRAKVADRMLAHPAVQAWIRSQDD